MKMRSLVRLTQGYLEGWPPTPHSIGDPPNVRHVCCYCQRKWWVVVLRVQNGVSIWGAVHLHQRWALDWTWIGLDPAIANFVKFGLDPDCKSLQNLGTGPDLDWVNGKEMRIFVVKRHFLNILDFIWTCTLHLKKIFGLWLDLDWVLKNQD